MGRKPKNESNMAGEQVATGTVADVAEPAAISAPIDDASEATAIPASHDGYGEGFADGLVHAAKLLKKRRDIEGARGVRSILDELVKQIERAAAAP